MRAAGYHILIIFAALFKNLTIMTKAEIVKEVSKSTGIEATTVMAVVEGFMEAVKGSLAKDNNVYLRGFGTFAVQTRAQKTARNITKNTTVIIPEHKVPTFKPCAEFKSQVK
jgi:DNA-binding protein HU-beta